MLLLLFLFGFMNNIFSGKKYRASPAGVSLMDETNNLTSHLERSPLSYSYGYEYFGRPALHPSGQPVGCSNLLQTNLSAGDRPTCLASLPLKSKSFMQYAG
jgi:hypothetical protein